MADGDPILAATNDVLRRLAKDGAQPTQVISECCERHGAAVLEWLSWARQAQLVERIYGASDDDPQARWAISPSQLIKIARDQRSS